MVRILTLLLSGVAGVVAGYWIGVRRSASRRLAEPPKDVGPTVPDDEILQFAAQAKGNPELSAEFARVLLGPLPQIRDLDPDRFESEVDRMVRLSQFGVFTMADAFRANWQIAALMKQRLDPLGLGDFSDIGVES